MKVVLPLLVILCFSHSHALERDDKLPPEDGGRVGY